MLRLERKRSTRAMGMSTIHGRTGRKRRSRACGDGNRRLGVGHSSHNRALTARHILSNDGERRRAVAMSKRAVKAAWSAVGLYGNPIRRRNHSFAPRIDSGSWGTSASAETPVTPRSESTAAMNHASYSQFATTTSIRQSERAVQEGRSQLGRAVVVSIGRTNIRASAAPSSRPAQHSVSSPGIKIPWRRTRIGLDTSNEACGRRSSPIRRINTGTPSPSTMATILATDHASLRKRSNWTGVACSGSGVS